MPDSTDPADAERPLDADATTRSPRPLAKRIVGQLTAAGIADAGSDAWLLLATVTGRARAALMAGALDHLTPAEEARLAGLVRRRAAREPMAYILREKEFWSMPFLVTPAVLIPRPETETVVEAALGEVADRQARWRILDFGTGSGCLLLALLSELPNATGLGVDRSEQALRIARSNAGRLGLADRARFAASDWGRDLEGTYDLIASNPPYVTASEWPALEPEVRAFEPAGALRAGPDGLDAYRALAPHLAPLLAPNGAVCLEIGQAQGNVVTTILARHGLSVTQRRRDLAGIERCLTARHFHAKNALRGAH